jgi:hypothetical protein
MTQKNERNQPNQPQQHLERDNSNRAPADYAKVGPTSIEGVEASDLPDDGRGDVFTNISKEAGRKLPPQTGQWGDAGDTGLRGDPDIADAKQHGRSRKHN